MSWNLGGSYVETCSCGADVSVQLVLGPWRHLNDFCRVTLVFDIREGEIDGTDIGGLTVALIADTPKVMGRRNWRLGVFIDEGASDEQAEKLGQVFGGQLGGRALAPLVGEMLASSVRRSVRHDGLRHSVRIGDAIDFEIQDIVPFGVETGEPVRFNGMFHPVGSDLTHGGGEAFLQDHGSASTRARPACPSSELHGGVSAPVVQSGGAGRSELAERFSAIQA